MISVCAGTPSRLSKWCETLLFELLRSAAAEPRVIGVDTVSDGARELLRLPRDSLLIVMRQPEIALADALIASETPFLLVLDEPSRCVGSLIDDHGYDAPSAIRYTANALGALCRLATAPKALIVRPGQERDGAGLAIALAEHFALNLPRETAGIVAQSAQVSAAAARTLDGPCLTTKRGGSDRMAKAPATSASALKGALDPLWTALTGEAATSLFWHKDLFFHGDEPSQPPPSEIDVSGPARCLVFGPYIRLAEGAWTCFLKVSLNEAGAGLRLVAEAIGGAPLNRAVFDLSEPGLFEIEFPFVVINADAPVEIRISSAQAAFEGGLTLHGARLVRLTVKRLSSAAT